MKILAEMASAVALSGALSLFTIFMLPQGGSITLASMVPVLLFALRRGAKVGIVEMEEGVKLPSIIRTSRLESLKIGMELEVDFSPKSQETSWPHWPRYFFKETE